MGSVNLHKQETQLKKALYFHFRGNPKPFQHWCKFEKNNPRGKQSREIRVLPLVQFFSPSPNKNKILRFSSIFPFSPTCFPLGLFLKILPHCRNPLGLPLKIILTFFNILAGLLFLDFRKVIYVAALIEPLKSL